MTDPIFAAIKQYEAAHTEETLKVLVFCEPATPEGEAAQREWFTRPGADGTPV